MSCSDLSREFDAFARASSKAHSILLTTHVNPDGDGLGSELALALHFRQRGSEVRVVNHSPTPPQYRFLVQNGVDFETYSSGVHDSIIAESPMILIVDTNHPQRLGSMASAVASSRATKVVIDHHLDPDPFADLSILDESSCATGEIAFHLLEYLGGFPLSKAAASGLYAAIMTDTGSFRFPKTDAGVHRTVSRLLEFGADPVSIYQRVYEDGPANRLKLLGEVLAGLRLAHDGKVCFLTVTRDMFERTETAEPDTDAFISSALAIGGVKIALLFTETADGVKVSFRSKGDIPINELAKEFGGNGHKNAAGARVAGKRLDQIIAEVVARTGPYLTA